MKRPLSYSIAAGFFPAVFFVVLIAWIFHVSRRDLMATTRLMEQNQRVVTEITHLESLLHEMEAGAQAYVVTGDASLLPQIEKAASAWPASLRSLRELLSTHAGLGPRVDLLDRLIPQKVSHVKNLVQTRRTSGFEASRVSLLSGQGRKSFDSILGVLQEIRLEQRATFESEAPRLDRQRWLMTVPFWLFVGLDIALLLITWYFVVDAISRREKAEALRLENARAIERSTVLERSNRELEQFAYVASHDLQEPLRKIQAFGDRLQSRYEEKLDGEGREYLARILHAARRMQGLIDGLLALSRVSSQVHPFERVNLKNLTSEVLSDLELSIENAGAKVTIGDLPTLEGDPLQLRQLFQNLLANALKFRKPGVSPEVNVTTEHDSDSYRIIVSDNGIGFEDKHAERIFKAFQRLHGAGEYEGTGIGLAVCKKIAQRHNGDIQAQGRSGEGARFIVTLPKVQPCDPSSEEA